jgi:hypothetical protein
MNSSFPNGPYLFNSGQVLIEDVWDSPQEDAQLFSYMLGKGYGTLPPGLVMAKNCSAAGGAGEYIPYVPALYDNLATNPYMKIGRSFLTADVADGDLVCYIPLADSYRFQVGDELILADDGSTTAENVGAISAIDITTSAVVAKLTFPYPVTAAGGFTLANSGCCYINGNASGILASNLATAVKQVDTLTLTGTSGTASITVAGNLTKTATFNSDLTTTASDFVTANATAYLTQGIVLTSSTADLIFTAQVAGNGHSAPVCTNATGDLAGTNVATTANVTGLSVVIENSLATGFRVGDVAYIVDTNSDAESLGAITAISKGSTNTTITVSTVATGSFATAQSAMLYTWTANMQTAALVNGRERESGYGHLTAAGVAMAQGVVARATMFKAAMGNIDDAAVAALGGKEYGGYVYL